jgi:hypothetical protein
MKYKASVSTGYFYDISKRFVMKRVTVYGVTFGLFFGSCALYASQSSKDTDVEVQEVPHVIVSTLGSRGVAELKVNGCMKSVVDRINGQSWSDDWCADRYKHVF